MATIPAKRIESDIHLIVTLQDSGVSVAWDTVDIKQICMFSVAQQAFAGHCSYEVDSEDNTHLLVTYPAEEQLYTGDHRIVARIELAGEEATYDALAFTLVSYTDSDGSVDTEDVNVGIEVQDVDTTIMYEILRNCEQATDDVQDVEAAVEAAEADRVTAENARVAAEEARVSAESARVTAEEARVSAESARVTAEEARVSAESSRVSVEASRVSAESARVTAEAGRVSAENARVSAESARVSAESARVSAETARENACSAAITNLTNTVNALNLGLAGLVVEDGELILVQNSEAGTCTGSSMSDDGEITLEFEV